MESLEAVWATEIETGIAEAAAVPFEIGIPVFLFADLQLCNHRGPAAAENEACSCLLSALHTPLVMNYLLARRRREFAQLNRRLIRHYLRTMKTVCVTFA